MDADGRPRHAALKGLGWAVVLLVVLLAALRAGDRSGPPPAAANLAPAGQTLRVRPHPNVSIRIPPDTGAKTARVAVEVFLPRHGGCECHVEAALLGQALGKVDPAHVKVVFRDLGLPENRARIVKLGAAHPCVGYAISGRCRFEVPYHVKPGPSTRTISLVADLRNWSFPDLYVALGQQYRAAYGTAFPVPQDTFVRALENELKTGRAQVVVSP
jgi:hypothetical protein